VGGEVNDCGSRPLQKIMGGGTTEKRSTTELPLQKKLEDLRWNLQEAPKFLEDKEEREEYRLHNRE